MSDAVRARSRRRNPRASPGSRRKATLPLAPLRASVPTRRGPRLALARSRPSSPAFRHHRRRRAPRRDADVDGDGVGEAARRGGWIANAAATAPSPRTSVATLPPRPRRDPEETCCSSPPARQFGPVVHILRAPPSSSAARSTHQFHRWFASRLPKRQSPPDMVATRRCSSATPRRATASAAHAFGAPPARSIDQAARTTGASSGHEPCRDCSSDRGPRGGDLAAGCADALGECSKSSTSSRSWSQSSRTWHRLDRPPPRPLHLRRDARAARRARRVQSSSGRGHRIRRLPRRARRCKSNRPIGRSRAFAAVRKAAAESRRIGGSRRTPAGDGETRGAEPPRLGRRRPTIRARRSPRTPTI